MINGFEGCFLCIMIEGHKKMIFYIVILEGILIEKDCHWKEDRKGGRDEKDMLISDRPFKLFVNCAEIISKIWT
jgi:hypothetical protein